MTSEMTEEQQPSKSLSVIQSMLSKLKSNEKVQPSGLHTQQFYTNSKDTDQDESNVTAVSHNVESTFARRNDSDTRVKPHRFDCTLRHAAGEDSETFTLEPVLHRSSPVIFPKWERRKYVSNHLIKRVEEDPQPSKSQPEWGEMMRKESGLKGETSGAESCFSCVKDTPSLLKAPSSVTGSTVSEMGLTLASLNSSQSKTFQKEGKSEAPGKSTKDAHTVKQGFTTISCENFENPASKTIRSFSDPVRTNKRSHRTLSEPSSHHTADMDRLTIHLQQANLISEQAALVKTNTQEPMECDGSCSKTQERIKKEKKSRNIAQKLIAKFKERNSPEESNSSSSHHGDEEATQSDFYLEETESPTMSQHSPLPHASEDSFTMTRLRLQRTFTLRDFTLDLEPINLMEEVLVGEEWMKFLPVKESLVREETSDQSQAESSHQSDDDRSHNSSIKQDPSTDREQSQSQSEMGRTSITDSALDEVNELHPRQRSSNVIFAVPKSLITSGAVRQKKFELLQHEPSTDSDVYDFVEVHMLPKDNPNWSKLNSVDPPLDLSAIEPTGVLDNSVLKSRIPLSKKRMHRPPTKRRREKSNMGQTSMLYMSTDVKSMGLPCYHSVSTNSSSPQSVASNYSAYKSSVFYSLPKLTPPCNSEVTPASADEKQKSKERPEKPKLWKPRN